MGKLAGSLENIDARLSSVERRLSRLEVETDTETGNVKQRLLNALPTPGEDADADYQEWAMSVSEAASHVAADEETVEEALDHLEEETGIVQRRFGGDPARKWYFKRS